MKVSISPKRTALLAAARERILVLDGAMGTMIQGLEYDEAAFRGERFKDFHRDPRGRSKSTRLNSSHQHRSRMPSSA